LCAEISLASAPVRLELFHWSRKNLVMTTVSKLCDVEEAAISIEILISGSTSDAVDNTKWLFNFLQQISLSLMDSGTAEVLRCLPAL
jgi:hypothetical protein